MNPPAPVPPIAPMDFTFAMLLIYVGMLLVLGVGAYGITRWVIACYQHIRTILNPPVKE